MFIEGLPLSARMARRAAMGWKMDGWMDGWTDGWTDGTLTILAPTGRPGKGARRMLRIRRGKRSGACSRPGRSPPPATPAGHFFFFNDNKTNDKGNLINVN